MTPSETAQRGRELIEEAILALLASKPDGLRNFEIAEQLGLASPKGQPQRNRFTWEVLMRLVEQGKVFETETEKGHALYIANR
jgi:hypothetical protein